MGFGMGSWGWWWGEGGWRVLSVPRKGALRGCRSPVRGAAALVWTGGWLGCAAGL